MTPSEWYDDERPEPEPDDKPQSDDPRRLNPLWKHVNCRCWIGGEFIEYGIVTYENPDGDE